MGTNSFTIFTKTYDIYLDISKDVKAKFETSSYELERTLPKGK